VFVSAYYASRLTLFVISEMCCRAVACGRGHSCAAGCLRSIWNLNRLIDVEVLHEPPSAVERREQKEKNFCLHTAGQFW